MCYSAKLTNFSIFLEIFSQQKIGKKEEKEALVLCYCKSILTIFILFIRGFELLVFRYSNISCKIRSTSSNKMACTMYTLGWSTAFKQHQMGPKWTSTPSNAPPWMDDVWTVYGQETVFRWVLVPRANLPIAEGSKIWASSNFGWPQNRQMEVVHWWLLRHTTCPWVWTSAGRISSSGDIRWTRYPSFLFFWIRILYFYYFLI